MTTIELENIWQSICPDLTLACIEADVKTEDNADLWVEINNTIRELSEQLSIESISRIPAIASSRQAYKQCGKDPARYRLSSEALLRRVVGGKCLYRISNVVDQLNLVSIRSGFSIGGYDAEKIQGPVQFGIAKQEPYEGIGRGNLNIEGLPVFRDETGPFGTPTSDSERTRVTESTRRFLMIIINFGASPGLTEAQQMAKELLLRYCSATNIEERIIHVKTNL